MNSVNTALSGDVGGFSSETATACHQPNNANKLYA